MQPLVWGTAMQHLFPTVPEARLPMIGMPSQDDASLGAAWLVTQRGESVTAGAPILVRDFYWLNSWWAWEQSQASVLGIYLSENMSPPPPAIRILCGKATDWLPYYQSVPQELLTQLGDAPMCILEVQPRTVEERTAWFVAQPGDIGDDYFFAVAADGKSVLEGTRLFYR
jgi:hypothetical protein